MKYLFKQITELHGSIQGWCSEERALETAAVVIALRPRLTVVVGVWGGRDTIAAAVAAREANCGTVWAIDPWSADASVVGMTAEHLEWWSKQDHEAIYQHFLGNLNIAGVKSNVLVFRKNSAEVSPPEDIGLLIIDGNHAAQALSDAERFGVKVKLGGMLFIDDINWPDGGGSKAITFLESVGFSKIGQRDGGFWMQRLRS